MFEGLRTVIYAAPEIKKAKEWYSNILNIHPYFDEPYYVGFNVQGYELGLQTDRTPCKTGSAVYWGVRNIHESWDFLIKHGASPLEEIMHVGGDVYVATVCDPFGNAFGIIQNPNFIAK